MIQLHVRQDLHFAVWVCKFILLKVVFFKTNWIVFPMSWFFKWDFNFLSKEFLFKRQGILFRIVVERWFRDSFLRVSLLHDFISILLKLVKKIIAWAFWKLAVLIPFKTDWFLSHLLAVYFYQSNWVKQLSFQESTHWGTTWIIWPVRQTIILSITFFSLLSLQSIFQSSDNLFFLKHLLFQIQTAIFVKFLGRLVFLLK